MTEAFSIFGFKFQASAGSFEQQVLPKLWSQAALRFANYLRTARSAGLYHGDDYRGRLYKKGLLDRRRRRPGVPRYTPRPTPEELQRVAALEGIRQLLGLASFVNCRSRIWWKR